MQAATVTSDSSVSSTSAVVVHTATELSEAPSTTEETLPQPEVDLHSDNGLDSTVMADCRRSAGDANEEGDACVSSQQMNSSSSDENENDNHCEEPDDGDNASEISEFSDFSQESWQPVQGPIAWVQEQMRRGQSPQKILEDLVPAGTVIPEGLDPIMLWKIIINIVSEPPKRKKLNGINTLDDVLRLLNTSKKIIVLTGAGVSVSCGIPDFRSRDGVYARLAKDFPNLPDPQAMFDIHFFRHDPRPFFKFAREIYPGQFRPSPCHHFIRMLEEKGKLLRNYTQNIDTLEQVAGIERVVQCHGSFAKATCTVCGHKVDSDAIKDDIFNQVIPHCPRCSPSDQNAVMKPDIVFFGESLPEVFHNQMAADKDECDLLIVIGSSLKVRPVALIPNSLPASVPQILINRERLHYLNFDVELLGNCDEIIGDLCRRLGPGWEELAAAGPPLSEVSLSGLPTPPASPHSDESRNRLDDARNPAVSSSEASKVPSDSTNEFPSESKGQPAQTVTIMETSEHKVTSAHTLNTHEDDDAQVVSTSQSEPSLTKILRGHHHYHHPSHRHSMKRPFASLSTTTDGPTDEAVSDLTGSDQASVFCSSKEVETLVSACHKKDVMYIPSEKSLPEHHGHHSQHTHDRTKPHIHHHHQGQSSLDVKNCCHSSTDLQVALPTYNSHGHSSDLSVSESKDVSTCQEIPTQQVDLESQLDSSEKSDQKPQSCGKNSEAADRKNRAIDEAGPENKKPRLSIKGFEEKDDEAFVEGEDGRNDPALGESAICDSVSQEGSLENIRKMWRSRFRMSLAQRLADNQVLFLPPSRYVFKGAEVFSGSESEDSDDEDDSGSDSDDDSDGEDGSSVDIDADRVAEDVIVSSDKPDTGDLDSPTSASCEKSSHQQKLTSSSSIEDDVEKALPLHNMLATQTEDSTVCSEKEITPRHNECTPSSVIPYPQNKLNDGSAQCPVSSTEDFDLEQTAQISSGLHSLQNQRD